MSPAACGPHLSAVRVRVQGLSFSLAGGEKVGICGRTGCGKTTLMMALYRIMELSSGRLLIDGVDVATLGLADLRSRLALVPQDPVVFSGSIRSNLDPFAEAASDGDLWAALRQAGMAATVGALPGQLDADVAEGGANLSTGQRQLLCMARALLRNAKILVSHTAEKTQPQWVETSAAFAERSRLDSALFGRLYFYHP